MMEFNKIFRNGAFDSLPVAAQADILRDRVRRLVVKESGVYAEIFGQKPEPIFELVDNDKKEGTLTSTSSRSRMSGVRPTRNGARGPKLVEHRICVLSHQAGWSSKKINLAELARLRWIENRSRREVADHFGASVETVKMHIRHLRSGRIHKVGLSHEVVLEIKSSWR